jgi:type IV pilus assembly protein PilP
MIRVATILSGVFLLGSASATAGIADVPKQMNAMRNDSIKMTAIPEIQRTAVPQSLEPAVPEVPAQGITQAPLPNSGPVGGYDPAGRRDPFAPILEQLQPGKADETLPPLQRVSLNELNLIAVIWGGYGYTAMVQTPDGHGYTVRRGTRVGQNNGVVSVVTERGIIVQERFTDVYGRKLEREHVKLLHPKEGAE